MTKQQRLTLVVSILASLVAFLDGAIVNVALPDIMRDLGGGLAAQQWVVDAYLLTLGAFILIAGSLSDLLGRKRILKLGLLGFGAASLLCALAPSAAFLIVARGLQGVAGALLVPSSLALIISVFSGPAQAKAIGSWTAWTGISFILGPLVGGFLVDQGSWRWIFIINVLPIAVTLYLLTRISVAEKRKANARVDLTGALLCVIGLGGPVFALIEQGRYGWSSPAIYLPLALGVIIFAGFLVYERRLASPMLPLNLFQNHNFSVGNVATFFVYAGLGAATFLLVVFLQQVAGYTALSAGMALVPVTLIMFVLSSRFGALSARFGPRLFMGFGPLIAAAGFLLIRSARIEVDYDVFNLSYWTGLFPGIVVFGLGLSVTVAPLTAAILGDVKKDQAGIASAVNNAVARIAGLIAVAAVGAVVAAQYGTSVDKLGRETFTPALSDQYKSRPLDVTNHGSTITTTILEQASVDAFRTGIGSIACLLAVGGAVSLVGIRNPRKA
jgi:EmrB/QacA subfamily drug resistance transporter